MSNNQQLNFIFARFHQQQFVKNQKSLVQLVKLLWKHKFGWKRLNDLCALTESGRNWNAVYSGEREFACGLESQVFHISYKYHHHRLRVSYRKWAKNFLQKGGGEKNDDAEVKINQKNNTRWQYTFAICTWASIEEENFEENITRVWKKRRRRKVTASKVFHRRLCFLLIRRRRRESWQVKCRSNVGFSYSRNFQMDEMNWRWTKSFYLGNRDAVTFEESIFCRRCMFAVRFFWWVNLEVL